MSRLLLFPFTRFDPTKLSTALHDIVSQRSNWEVLRQDFPNLNELYGTPGDAYLTVRRRQRNTTTSNGYLPMAVLAGRRVLGAVTLMNMALPATPIGDDAVNFAGWLDPSRPASLRGLGVVLAMHVFRVALTTPTFEGHLWTVVRPENKGAMRVCCYTGYSRVELRRSQRSVDFSVMDGVEAPRHLFVSRRSISEMRADD